MRSWFLQSDVTSEVQPPDTPQHLRIWNKATIPSHLLYPAHTQPAPSSRSTLELDIHVSAILNRLHVPNRPLHHDFTELRWGLPNSGKLVGSLEELWEDERRRRREAGKNTQLEPKQSQEDRLGFEGGAFPGRKVGWNTEERWWSEVERRKQEDRSERHRHGLHSKLSFEDLIRAAGGPMQENRERWDKVRGRYIISRLFWNGTSVNQHSPV